MKEMRNKHRTLVEETGNRRLHERPRRRRQNNIKKFRDEILWGGIQLR